MPAVVVRHEAGKQFDPLAEQIEAVAAETLPLVEAVTALPLPDPVVIRTMTVPAWKKAHRRSTKRLLLAETEELAPSTHDLRTALVTRKLRLKVLRRQWPAIGAQAVLFEPGQPELVILPEALRHGGRLGDTPFLYKTLAHEPTHLAQYAASEGSVWAAQDTLYPALRGVADRAYGFLLEGHAYWADQQITAKILGEPVRTARVPPRAFGNSSHLRSGKRTLSCSPRRWTAWLRSSKPQVSTASTGSGRARISFPTPRRRRATSLPGRHDSPDGDRAHDSARETAESPGRTCRRPLTRPISHVAGAPCCRAHGRPVAAAHLLLALPPLGDAVELAQAPPAQCSLTPFVPRDQTVARGTKGQAKPTRPITSRQDHL
ncbi:hypothetical protein [Streptomyces sp. NPDC005538]|uniref:hypothetical protein n=1 Tax=unclassified Streptomyces TaxID=2593676 RepID=UPI00339F582B